MSLDSIGHGPQDDLSALERRLGNWRPASGGVDRDRLLFEAGRAAACTGSWVRFGWLSSACLALVAFGLGGLFVRERGNRRALEAALAVRTAAPAPVAQVAPPIVALDPESYFALTRRLLAAGADDAALAASSPEPAHRLVPPEPALSPLDAARLGRSMDL